MTATHKTIRTDTMPARWVIIGVAITAAAIIIAAWYAARTVNSAPTAPAQHSAYTARIQELNRQQIPSDPAARALYFADLGQNYAQAGDQPRALTAYLQAQQTVDGNGLWAQVAFYEPIADIYLAQGNPQQASHYLQQYRAYLYERLKNAPDDPAITAAIGHTEARLRGFLPPHF